MGVCVEAYLPLGAPFFAQRVLTTALRVGCIEDINIDFSSIQGFTLKALCEYCLG